MKGKQMRMYVTAQWVTKGIQELEGELRHYGTASWFKPDGSGSWHRVGRDAFQARLEAVSEVAERAKKRLVKMEKQRDRVRDTLRSLQKELGR